VTLVRIRSHHGDRVCGAFGKVFPLKVGVAGVIDGVCVCRPIPCSCRLGARLCHTLGTPARVDRGEVWGLLCTVRQRRASPL
jgi:hypothetical protein